MPKKGSERARNSFKIVSKNIKRQTKGEKMQLEIFFTMYYFKFFGEVLRVFILPNAKLNFCCSQMTFHNKRKDHGVA